MDSDILADVEALLRLNLGDSRRLDNMRSRIRNDRPLYNSDRRYIEELKDGVGTSKPPAVSQTVVPQPGDGAGRMQHAAPDTVRSDSATDKSTVTTSRPHQSSAAWYLLPVFMPIMGGVISYLCLRKQDPSRARKTLIVGAVLSVVPVLLLASALGFIYEQIESTSVSSTDLSDEQIKQSALAVPYKSLMEDNEAYVGEIIQYEGEMVQARDSLNSYLLRISVPDDESSEGGSVWSNFDPGTDEEEQWVETLEKELGPFERDKENVRVWGIFTGLREYSTIFGNSKTVPEVDIYILERMGP